MKKLKSFYGFSVLFLFAFGGTAMAQSTIFNIPTTDTVVKGKVYGEFGFLVQASGADGSRTYVYNPRVIVGGPKNFEFGVNVPVTNIRSTGDSTSNAYIQPNIKWRFYENEKMGIAAAAGALLNTPLNNRGTQDSWGLLYGLASKKFKGSDYGPRFHAGPYGVVSANQDGEKGPISFTGPRAGVILGYEQPLHEKISLVADWFSGKNGYGYFTPGVSLLLPRNGLLNAGYSIGNDSWADNNATKNRYFFIYYGKTF